MFIRLHPAVYRVFISAATHLVRADVVLTISNKLCNQQSA